MASTAADRWAWVVPHREQLLVIARRRTASDADAEDCVHEAMICAVERENLDRERVGGFLCTTVLRLIVNKHRDRERAYRAGVREWQRQLPPMSHEESICQREEARWLVDRLSDVRGREAQLLQARGHGMSVSDFATAEGISVKAAENAWARVRSKGQRALAATAALLAPLVVFRRGGVVAAPAAVAVATVFLWDLGTAPSQAAPALPERAVVQSSETRPLTTASAPPPEPVVDRAQTSSAPPQADTASAPPEQPARPQVPVIAPPLPDVEIQPVDAGLVRTGGVRAQEENTDESLEESVAHCLRNVDPRQPLADPCDH